MVHYEVTDGVALVRLDAPPLNAISLEMLQALREAVRRAAEDESVRGLVVAGDEKHFSAGADIGLFEQIATSKDAVELSGVFQEAFQEIEDSPKPVVAALAGKVLGGALELAAACHARVCAKDARFQMPEVNLGILPGAGGTQRLPRLAGPELALRMMLTASTVGAREALEAGLVDAVCAAEELLSTARRLAGEGSPSGALGATGSLPASGRGIPQPAWEAALAKAEGQIASFHPEIAAPRKIIHAVRTGLGKSFEAGLRAEQEGFRECMASRATRSRIYLFFATRQAGKVPELADLEPRPIQTVAVVGLGSMGSGIAQALLSSGLPVLACDRDPEMPLKARAKIEQSLGRRASAGKLAPEKMAEMLGRFGVAASLEGVAEADVVIEAVFEDFDVKRGVLSELEAACPAETILATNTSTISLEDLAAGMHRPERLVGLHFFNPAHRMPLVEVIRHERVDRAVLATAVRLVRDLRKTPVVVRNREGFLVNRLFLPYLKEAFLLLEEGARPEALDRAMVAFGMPMGPLTLIDMAGLDVLVLADRVMREAFPRHGAVSDVAVRLVDEGRLGQKSGGGIYSYTPGDYTPHPSEPTEQVLHAVRRERDIRPREVPEAEIADRLLLRMAGEAFWVLQEGIAERESDLDVATVLGLGFPDFRGGVVRYARDRGLGDVLARLQSLTTTCGPRFAPSPRLQELIEKGTG